MLAWSPDQMWVKVLSSLVKELTSLSRLYNCSPECGPLKSFLHFLLSSFAGTRSLLEEMSQDDDLKARPFLFLLWWGDWIYQSVFPAVPDAKILSFWVKWVDGLFVRNYICLSGWRVALLGEENLLILQLSLYFISPSRCLTDRWINRWTNRLCVSVCVRYSDAWPVAALYLITELSWHTRAGGTLL